MVKKRIESLIWAALLLALAASSGNVLAASTICKYPQAGTQVNGSGMGGTGNAGEDTGMGGTGIVAKGTGMGGTGSRPDTGFNIKQIAGTVIESTGTAEARQNGNSRLLAKNVAICVGETVVTAKSGTIKIRMADGGLVEVHAQSKLKIEKFIFGRNKSDRSVIALLDGSSRFVTGKIGKKYPQNVLVITPTATIGVHGTDHVATVIPPGSNGEYPAGTYDMVNSGVTFIRTENGEIDIQPNQVGFAASEGEPPTLLHDIPVFYLDDRAAIQHEGQPEAHTRESPENIRQIDMHSDHAGQEHEIFNPVDNLPSILEHHDIEDIPDIPELNEHSEHPVIPEPPDE